MLNLSLEIKFLCVTRATSMLILHRTMSLLMLRSEIKHAIQLMWGINAHWLLIVTEHEHRMKSNHHYKYPLFGDQLDSKMKFPVLVTIIICADYVGKDTLITHRSRFLTTFPIFYTLHTCYMHAFSVKNQKLSNANCPFSLQSLAEIMEDTQSPPKMNQSDLSLGFLFFPMLPYLTNYKGQFEITRVNG